MGKDTNQPQTVNIDGVEYQIADMADDQKLYLENLLDLDRKIGNMNFQLGQLQVGRGAFMTMLKNSLIATKAIAEANAAEEAKAE